MTDLDSNTVSVLLFILNVVLGSVVYLMKRVLRLQDEKMTATVTQLHDVRARIYNLEIMLPKDYLTKQEFLQFREEINNNFMEVQRDLKLILRTMGVRSVGEAAA